MPTTQFVDALQKLRSDIRVVRGRDGKEPEVGDLISQFLRDAFSIEVHDWRREADAPRGYIRGNVDLLIGTIAIEFKRRLASEADAVAAAKQCSEYAASPRISSKVILVTDGVAWHAYAPDSENPRPISKLNLASAPEEDCWRWLDAYLFTGELIPLTAQEVTARFGPGSPAHRVALDSLHTAWQAVRETPEARTKYAQWAKLLSIVYGREVESEDLFLRHTYLALLARLFVYAAVKGRFPAGQADLEGLVTGSVFLPGIRNLGEDFFAWVLRAGEVGGRVLAGLSEALARHDAATLGSADVFQGLYQGLVDPEDRHDLGEYYTPDWLADLLVSECPITASSRILDPTCGSGTFLRSAIEALAREGVTGHALCDHALRNVVGIDAHPLAVLVSKANYVLALRQHGDFASYPGGHDIPVYMADSLLADSRVDVLGEGVPYETERGTFVLPRTDEPGDLLRWDEALSQMAAHSDAPGTDAEVIAGFTATLRRLGVPRRALDKWCDNLQLLRTLKNNDEDSVWAFILANAARPYFLSLPSNRFDLVVGNPPWLRFSEVRSPAYRDKVVDLSREFGVCADDHLRTSLELGAVFMVHAAVRSVKPEGTVAMVMPRNAIAYSGQYRGLQMRVQPALVLDFRRVRVKDQPNGKIFNQDCCCVVWPPAGPAGQPLVRRYGGTLDRKDTAFAVAMAQLATTDGPFAYPTQGQHSPYRDLAQAGANIYPRTMWFVTRATENVSPTHPWVETDQTIVTDAKPPWRTIRMAGEVEAEFLKPVVLSRTLLPFHAEALEAVVPVERKREGPVLLDSAAAYRLGFPRVGRWLDHRPESAERGDISLASWVNWQHKLTDQAGRGTATLVYNVSGSHVSSCVVPDRQTLVDYTLYWVPCSSTREAHYLCALINSGPLDSAIQGHLATGVFQGGRHICRRLFEVPEPAVPEFDPDDPDHRALARLSVRCHRKAAAVDVSKWRSQARKRQAVREALAEELARIDEIVERVLS